MPTYPRWFGLDDSFFIPLQVEIQLYFESLSVEVTLLWVWTFQIPVNSSVEYAWCSMINTHWNIDPRCSMLMVHYLLKGLHGNWLMGLVRVWATLLDPSSIPKLSLGLRLSYYSRRPTELTTGLPKHTQSNLQNCQSWVSNEAELWLELTKG